MIWNLECGRYVRSSHVPYLFSGRQTKFTENQTKEYQMRAKLNDKNLKNLADQTEKKIVDKGLGMATPFLLGKENPDPVIKLEFPAQKTLNADILIAKIAYLVFVHLTSTICEMQQLIMLLDTCAKQCFQSVSNRFMDCMTPTIDVQVGKEHQEQQQNYDSLWLCSS